MKTYKDWFTLDGLVKPGPGVTKRKVEAVRDLTDKALKGSRIALGTLTEALTTSDASLNLAHLVNIDVLPQYDEAPRTWTQVAGTYSVSDFRPATLYSLVNQWSDGALGDGEPRHISPRVPEGAPYPYATFTGEEYQSARLAKRGFKTGFTFEALVNDTLGVLRALPENMLQVALDTEEYEVYTALVNGVGSSQQLDGGTVPDGTVVPANASLGRAALIQAKIELGQRTINGRPLVVTGGFNLVVAVGQGLYADFVLNTLRLEEETRGAQTFSINGYNPLADVTVVESEYVTGTAWYLVPKPGGSRRRILDRLVMTGRENPEVRVNNLTGTYVGGGTVSPFEGSFDTDTADYRIRQIISGVLWTPDLVVWSTGAGGAETAPGA